MISISGGSNDLLAPEEECGDGGDELIGPAEDFVSSRHLHGIIEQLEQESRYWLQQHDAEKKRRVVVEGELLRLSQWQQGVLRLMPELIAGLKVAKGVERMNSIQQSMHTVDSVAKVDLLITELHQSMASHDLASSLPVMVTSGDLLTDHSSTTPASSTRQRLRQLRSLDREKRSNTVLGVIQQRAQKRVQATYQTFICSIRESIRRDICRRCLYTWRLFAAIQHGKRQRRGIRHTIADKHFIFKTLYERHVTNGVMLVHFLRWKLWAEHRSRRTHIDHLVEVFMAQSAVMAGHVHRYVETSELLADECASILLQQCSILQELRERSGSANAVSSHRSGPVTSGIRPTGRLSESGSRRRLPPFLGTEM
jgi:hypothetical protein